jgi:signal transduction histidine kinase
LGFPRAIVALVNPDSPYLSSWLSKNRVGGVSTSLPHIARIPFKTDRGALAEALRQEQPRTVTNGAAPSDNPSLNEQMALGECYVVLPLIFRAHPVGIVAVSLTETELNPADENALRSIVNQAAVALSNVQLCIDRTRRLTVEEERNRIAREIHDNVSQSLFGFVYTLDSCIKLLPEQPDVVKTRLVNLHPQAIEVMNKVRQSIFDLWESEVTANYFQSELQRYTRQVCQSETIALKISVDEEFDTLEPGVRRTFLRVAQESMANVVKHARASQASIAVILFDGEAILVVVDDGIGLEPRETGLAAGEELQHFGLQGMQERIALLGGRLTLDHRCDRGTMVVATVPVVQNGRQ